MFDWIMHNKGLFLTSYTEIGGNHQHAVELQTQHNHFAMNCMVRRCLCLCHAHTHTLAIQSQTIIITVTHSNKLRPPTVVQPPRTQTCTSSFSQPLSQTILALGLCLAVDRYFLSCYFLSHIIQLFSTLSQLWPLCHVLSQSCSHNWPILPPCPSQEQLSAALCCSAPQPFPPTLPYLSTCTLVCGALLLTKKCSWGHSTVSTLQSLLVPLTLYGHAH